MWRDQAGDLAQIEAFITSVREFQELKQRCWRKIDDQVQMQNPMGTPGEDWIIPPDEGIVENRLEQDPIYADLKEKISGSINQMKEIAHFLHFDEHHEFDFVNFTSPLIGNGALEDGLNMARRLKKACEGHNYVFQNLVSLFKKAK